MTSIKKCSGPINNNNNKLNIKINWIFKLETNAHEIVIRTKRTESQNRTMKKS